MFREKIDDDQRSPLIVALSTATFEDPYRHILALHQGSRPSKIIA